MSDLQQLIRTFGQRRAFALVEPRQQARLALSMLAITAVFVVLAVANSYSAFAPILQRAVTAAPEVWAQDLMAQAGLYLVVTLSLAVLYAAAMVGASIAFVSQVMGPLTAIRRHARSLKMGRYSSRVQLRAGGHRLYGEIAEQFNELAEELERQGTPPPEEVREAA
ncbi:MAG: hypothetical protein QF570_00930 [Myxococcota bacterium]|jgi:nitrogen fixation/metabolism regulation signal transduction histidine kinase|nr:hypothetical protein [Myxococcota bacterium]